eukprot:CAMPEP_0181021986 /NCGR_PEP_ID=MMETSP1070-20121207/1276_1 /TAXON_ID=265543 /ORGANISM="Minutocellus polymorphus, Strain NH13" /LENGTH=235 /DNA_ID=CAMNT_0023098903 /DNA_START=359 /DNA_END=1065 /DNA_ORIENTATION=-
MSEYLEYFFLNPAVAVDLGLFDLLRFMVEELGVDCTRNRNGIRCQGDEFDDLPLMAHAIIQTDPQIFQYVLSLDSVSPNPEIMMVVDNDIEDVEDYNTSMIGSHNPIGDAIRDSYHVPTSFIQRLELILNSKNVDSLNIRNETPLDALIRHSYSSYKKNRYTYSYASMDIRIAKAFLDAGARERICLTRSIPRHDKHLGGFQTTHRAEMRALFTASDEPQRCAVIAKLRRGKRAR